MDLASLRFTRPRDPVPASAEEQVRLGRLLADHPPLAAPFEGVMTTGSFNTGVAGSLADRPVEAGKQAKRASILSRR